MLSVNIQSLKDFPVGIGGNNSAFLAKIIKNKTPKLI